MSPTSDAVGEIRRYNVLLHRARSLSPDAQPHSRVTLSPACHGATEPGAPPSGLSTARVKDNKTGFHQPSLHTLTPDPLEALQPVPL
ncbi:unnamed protein product [Gadus morhua 'NCC']